MSQFWVKVFQRWYTKPSTGGATGQLGLPACGNTTGWLAPSTEGQTRLWHQEPGTKNLILGSWYQDQGTVPRILVADQGRFERWSMVEQVRHAGPAVVCSGVKERDVESSH